MRSCGVERGIGALSAGSITSEGGTASGIVVSGAASGSGALSEGDAPLGAADAFGGGAELRALNSAVIDNRQGAGAGRRSREEADAGVVGGAQPERRAVLAVDDRAAGCTDIDRAGVGARGADQAEICDRAGA